MKYGWRAGVVIALIVAMAVALASLLLRDSDAASADTTLTPTTTSLPPTTTSTPTSTTTAATTTTTDPKTRIAEVELILEDLYVRWFDAIYRKDESALPDIVALQDDYDSGVKAMSIAEFVAAPAEVRVDVSIIDILLDRSDCLAIHYEMDVSRILGPGRTTEGLRILWVQEGGAWRMGRLWGGPGDLWEIDCDLADQTELL